MADLNRKTEHFIDMLLDVAGKARLMDLASVDQEQASALLQAYANAHPERDLTFDGHVLTESPAQAPQPPAPVEQPTAPPPAASPWEMPVEQASPQPSVAPPAHEMFGVPPAAVPSDVPQYDFPQAAGDASGSLADIVPEVAQPYPVPEIQPAFYPPAGQPYDPYTAPGEFGAVASQPGVTEEPAFPQPAYPPAAADVPAGMPTPEYGIEYPQLSTPAYDAAAASDAETWQADVPEQAYDAEPPVASDYVEFPEFATSEKVSPLWWLAVVFFGFIGAVVAWFVNRGKPGSKPFLIVAIVYVALVVLGIVAALLVPLVLQGAGT